MSAVLCSWCDEPATWVLVTDADLHNHDHPACERHRDAWVHLYRRAVEVADGEFDLRDEVDLRNKVDLSLDDEPVGRHER